MDFGQCLEIIVNDPKNALYELNVILYNISLNEVDQLTFVLLLHKKLFELLDLLISEDNTSALVELIVIVYSRYNIQRFPSFNGQMLLVLDKTYETLINLANMDKIETLDALMQGFFRLLKNSYLYQYFTQNDGYTRLQNLIYQTFNYNSYDINSLDYEQQLIPQTQAYGYSNTLYYIQQLFWTFKDEKMLRIQFLILINQEIEDKIHNNSDLERQIISDEDFKAVAKSQRNLRFMFHNIIYIITTYGRYVTKLMIDSGYFEFFSQIQNNLKDETFTFITKLILQDTMQEQYNQITLLQLCKTCIVDNSLIVFYANQISYLEEFTKDIKDQTTQLILSVLKQENSDYVSTCMHIVEYINKYDSNYFINYFVVPILGSSLYPNTILTYVNDRFSQICQQQKYKQLSQSKQLLIFQSLLNDLESGQSQLLNQLLQLATNYKNIGYIDNLIEYLKQKIQEIVSQNKVKLQTNLLFEILHCYLNNIIVAYTDEQIQKFGIYQQLISLSQSHETVRYLCYKTIFRLNFGKQGLISFNKLLRFVKFKIHPKFIDSYITTDIQNAQFNNQALVDQLLYTLYYKGQYLYLYIYLKLIYNIYRCDNILLSNLTQEQTQQLTIKRCSVNTNLANALYDIWVQLISRKKPRLPIDLENVIIKKVFTILEEIILSILSFSGSTKLIQSLMYSGNKQVEKYLLIIISDIQNRIYKLKYGEFLSQLPIQTFSVQKNTFYPININTNNLVADTRHILEYNIPLHFQNFKICFDVQLRSFSKIFTLSEYYPSQNSNFIAISYYQNQLQIQLFDHNTNIGISSILQKFVSIEIQIQETKMQKYIDLNQIAINDTLIFDANSKSYMQYNIQLQYYILSVCVNKQLVYQEIIALPTKTIIILERSYLQLYPQIYYNSMQIIQNNFPLLSLQRGQMYFYHGICLPESEYYFLYLQQAIFQKVQYDNIPDRLFSEMEAQKYIKIYTDSYNTIQIQNGFISLSYQSNLTQRSANNFTCFKKQGQTINTYELEQKMTLCQMEEIDSQSRSMILRKTSLQKVRYMADYTQLNSVAYLNYLIIQLERSDNILFDLVYLNTIIWRSNELFDYFQKKECFQELVQIMSNQNKKDLGILILFKIIGFDIQVCTHEDKKEILKIKVSEYQNDQNIKNLIILLQAKVFQMSFTLQQKLDILEFICKGFGKYPYMQRIQIMRTSIDITYQYLDELTEQYDIDLTLSKLENIISYIFEYYNVENRDTFINFQSDEIFQYSQVINYQLIKIVKHLFDTQNNQSCKMQMLYAIIIPYILKIDQILLSIYYNNDQIVKEQYLQNIHLLLGSISEDVLILALQYIKDKDIIQQILSVINIVQSQSQMISEVNLHNQADNLLYHDLQYCIQPFNIQNLIYSYINTQVNKDTQKQAMSHLLQMSLNRYNVRVGKDMKLHTSNRTNEEQMYQIINHNSFFTFFKICRECMENQSYLNIVCFILQQQQYYNVMSTVILEEIIRSITLNLSDGDIVYQQILNILKEKQDIGQKISQFKYILSQIDSTIYIQEKNLYTCTFLSKLIQLLLSPKLYKDSINLIEIESYIYTSLQLQINESDEENSSVNSHVKMSRTKSILKPSQNSQQTIIYVIISIIQQSVSNYTKDLNAYHIVTLIIQHYYIQLLQQQQYKAKSIESLLQIQKIHKILFSQSIYDENELYLSVQLMLETKSLSHIFKLGFQMANYNLLYKINNQQIESIIQMHKIVYSQEFYTFINNIHSEDQKQQFSLLQLNQIFYQIIDAVICLLNCSVYKCENIMLIEKVEQFNNKQFQYSKSIIEYTIHVLSAIQLNTSKISQNLNVFENTTSAYSFLLTIQSYIINSTNQQCKEIIVQLTEKIIQNMYQKKQDELSMIISIKSFEIENSSQNKSNNLASFEKTIRSFQFSDIELNQKLYILQHVAMFNQTNMFQQQLQWKHDQNDQQSKLQALEGKEFTNQNSINIIQNILYTLQQKQNKISEQSNQMISINSKLFDYLCQNFTQLAIEQKIRPIALNSTPVYHRIIQSAYSLFDDVRYAQQSSYINGHTYERLFVTFVTMKPYRRRKEKIISIFNSFKELQPNMYYSMRLQVQGNRVGYTFVYQNYIYVFSDSPQGEYFLQNKQSDSFKDFDVLVDSHIQETRKAYQKLPNSTHVNAELFNEQYWQPQLTRYTITQIISILERDYGGLSSAVDIHFNNGYSISLVFACYQEMVQFIQTIREQNTPLLRFTSQYINTCNTMQVNIDKLQNFFKDNNISNKKSINLNKQLQLNLNSMLDKYVLNLLCHYQTEDIKAFQLIYECNLLSARSYNDLSQYFIFPVLYGTHGTDLELQPRNLKLPVLFQGKQRLNDLIQKYESARQFNVQSSISAIHFSHCAIPCWWAIREEPFASAHLLLQGCKFDAGDRLFCSVCAQFGNSMFWNQQNCEENIPEIFYDSFMLVNINRYDLGQLQSGDKVEDVIIYSLLGQKEYKELYYGQMQLDYLNNAQIKKYIFQWISIIFSSKGYMVKIFDEISSIYPPIGNYVSISKDQADQSLQLIMQSANEIAPHSVVMKLIYFGKQPHPLVVCNEQAINIDETKQEEIESVQLLNSYIKNYQKQFAQSETHTEFNDTSDYTIKYTKKQKIQYAIGSVIEAALLNIEKYVTQAERQNILNPGLLCGRRSNIDNCNFQYNTYLAENGSQKNDHYTNINEQYKYLNSSNSLLLGSVFCIPCNLQLIFSTDKQYSEYLGLYSDKYLKIYSLHKNLLYDRQYIGDDVIDYIICSNNYLQFDGTHNVYVLRSTSIIEVYMYDIHAKTIVSIGQLPLILNIQQQIVAYSDKQTYRLYYQQSWGILLIYSEKGYIQAFDILNLQGIWEVNLNHDILQIEGSSEKPLIIVLTDDGIKVINTRNMFISPLIISERFECIIYSDSEDTLYAAKNSFLHKIKNVYKNHLQSMQQQIKIIGHLDKGSRFLESSIVRRMFIVNNSLYLYVEDNPDKYMYEIDVEVL